MANFSLSEDRGQLQQKSTILPFISVCLVAKNFSLPTTLTERSHSIDSRGTRAHGARFLDALQIYDFQTFTCSSSGTSHLSTLRVFTSLLYRFAFTDRFLSRYGDTLSMLAPEKQNISLHFSAADKSTPPRRQKRRRKYFLWDVEREREICYVAKEEPDTAVCEKLGEVMADFSMWKVLRSKLFDVASGQLLCAVSAEQMLSEQWRSFSCGWKSCSASSQGAGRRCGGRFGDWVTLEFHQVQLEFSSEHSTAPCQASDTQHKAAMFTFSHARRSTFVDIAQTPHWKCSAVTVWRASEQLKACEKSSCIARSSDSQSATRSCAWPRPTPSSSDEEWKNLQCKIFFTSIFVCQCTQLDVFPGAVISRERLCELLWNFPRKIASSGIGKKLQKKNSKSENSARKRNLWKLQLKTHRHRRWCE